MNFNEFTKAVKEGLEALFENDEIEIGINRVPKNNGLVLTGVNIREKDALLAPTIYLDEFYYEDITQNDINEVVLQIRRMYLGRKHGTMAKQELGRYYDFDWVKGKVIYTLVNQKMNEERLKSIPHIPFLDLAILFRCVFHAGSTGIASSIISNDDLIRWNVDTKCLYQLAAENTPHMFPAVVEKVAAYLTEESGLTEFMNTDPTENIGELYVMTNQIAVNGAAVMLYPELLAECAERVNDDIYILPSSIHELIFVAAGKASDTRMLCSIVEEVNEKMVNHADLLSYQIYRYDRAMKKVELYHEN